MSGRHEISILGFRGNGPLAKAGPQATGARKEMKLSKVMTMSHVLTMAMCAVVFGLSLSAQASPEAAAEASEAVAKAPVTDMVAMSKNLAIALTMGCGSFAAALAVGKIGVAAMGAAAEKPEVLGKAIAFVGLGEGIALFGFLVSLFLLMF